MAVPFDPKRGRATGKPTPVVTDIRIPFWRLMIFLMKVALASVPAALCGWPTARQVARHAGVPEDSVQPLRRHIVHVDHLIQAFERLLDNPSALGQTFNIAGPAAFDYRVAAEYISRRRSIPSVELRCPDYHSFEINITRARTLLGYAPENDIFRMADRAIAFIPAP